MWGIRRSLHRWHSLGRGIRAFGPLHREANRRNSSQDRRSISNKEVVRRPAVRSDADRLRSQAPFGRKDRFNLRWFYT